MHLCSGKRCNLAPALTIAVLVVFSMSIPTFPTAQNLASVLVNNFALLAIVSIGMTLVVAAGGIDLSVGTAVDFSSLAFVFLVLGGHAVWLSTLAGLAAGLAVGLFNAFLIARLGITPFLATLGTLFIGHSGQQLLTGGGNPVYLPSSVVPPSFAFLGHGAILGIPVVLIAVAVLGVAVAILLKRSRLGRIIVATGRPSQRRLVLRSANFDRQRSRLCVERACVCCGGAHPVGDGQRLRALFRERLSAERHRRHLYWHNARSPWSAECSRHADWGPSSGGRCKRTSSLRTEFLLATGRHRRSDLPCSCSQFWQRRPRR
jgi:ABC-type uncharacterized transport system permease subunit